MSTTTIELPDTLYCPPGEWGGSDMFATEEEVGEFLDWAAGQGDEWSGVDIGDAERLDLIREIAPGIGLYEGGMHHDGYHKNCRNYGYVVKARGNGEFDTLAQLDTINDCDDADYADA